MLDSPQKPVLKYRAMNTQKRFPSAFYYWYHTAVRYLFVRS